VFAMHLLKLGKRMRDEIEHKWTVQDIPSQEGRLAVVTGATSGIGFHTAKGLASR
jgi:hypothetical protein